MRRLHRWLGLVSLVSALAVTATLSNAAPVTAQSAGNGLEEQSVNSFEFDPSRGVVRVTIDITLRNVTTDRVDGNVINRSFFDAYGVAVPLGAENIVATRNGSVLNGTLEPDPEFPAFSPYRIDLGTQLFSGQSTTLQVTYDHLGAAPRDPVPWRINEAYAGFIAFGLGDEGLVTVRITQPFGYEFDEFTDLTGFDTSAPDGFGTVVHTRGAMTEDDVITVSLANNDRLVSRALTVDGVDIELRSWPDDPEWADFAAARVEAGIPALESLIGSPWPVDGNFDVRQSLEPNLAGYAGWFDLQSSEIAVGEELDADTIYHELSHAWFNGRVSPERWFTEGLAQVYAAELIRLDGEVPRTATVPSPDDPVAQPLTDWGDVGSPREVEEYGYNASFWVLDALIDEIGFESSGEVVDALATAASPYGGEGVAFPTRDWQRAYDMLVEVGGSAGAGDLFRAHVVNAEDAPLIEQRDRAATEVAGLAERSAPWTLPLGVRNSLELWEIDDTVDGVVAADQVLELRSTLASIEEAVGIDEPDDPAAAAYASAPRQDAAGVDFSAPTELLAQAIEVGATLEVLADRIDVLADDAEATPPVLGAVSGVDDFASGVEAADAQVLALERIIEVDDQLDAASGFVVAVGRWGSGIESDLDTARSEVEAGNSADALTALESADEQIDELAASGALRLALAGALVLALLFVLLLLRRSRNRRTRRRGGPSDDLASTGATGAAQHRPAPQVMPDQAQ